MKQEKALTLGLSPAGAAFDFSGHWTNELNSTMDLNIVAGVVSGSYTSTVSGTGHQITGPVTGFASGRIISFAVNWPNASITAWVGHVVTENGEDIIETLWHLATIMPKPDDPNELWESVLAGADRFHR